ncbi:putative DD41D transposase [Trichonephila clavipes]|nr:putative DD41D transposase [Trichonephila clavipes]
MWCKFFQKEEAPNLLKIVQFVSSVPVSNAFVERIFSVMGNVWTDERNRLAVNTVKIRTHERTRGRKVASSSPVATEDPPYKWVRGSVSTFCCSVVGKGSLAQVSFSSLDRGPKLEVRNNSPSSHNVTVNGDLYRALITNFFISELNNHDVQELWFQQDRATCHTAHATIDLLKDTFGHRLISRFGPVNWPPRSCDLTPLDYFLGGYVKSLVYADKPQTLDHLEDNIRRVIADIRPQMLEKVNRKLTSRLDYIRASRGSPMPEIIFKM